MSKSAALLLVLALGAGACSTTEPPQSIVAVVPASDTDVAIDDSLRTPSTTEAETPESTEVERPEPEATEAPLTTTAPETTPVPSTTPAPTVAPAPGSLAEILSGSINDDAWAVSARFEGGIEITGNIEGESIEMDMGIDGAFDSATSSMEMSIDMSSIGQLLGVEEMSEADSEMFEAMFAEPMQMRSIGNTAWIKWSLLDMLTGTEGKWLESELSGADVSSVGTSPADIIHMLNGLDGDITTVGADTIAGVPTTHYSVAINLQALADLAGSQEFEDLNDFAAMFEDLPIDIWVDADGRLRRLEMSLSSDMFAALLGPADSFSMSIWYEISVYGADVIIVAPPADEIISGDSLDLF